MPAKRFIVYNKSKKAGANSENLEMLRAGTTPRYWFLEYSKEHSALRRICDSLQPTCGEALYGDGLRGGGGCYCDRRQGEKEARGQEFR